MRRRNGKTAMSRQDGARKEMRCPNRVDLKELGRVILEIL
jgi:hypothetical protein